jgi:hypothetical protein
MLLLWLLLLLLLLLSLLLLLTLLLTLTEEWGFQLLAARTSFKGNTQTNKQRWCVDDLVGLLFRNTGHQRRPPKRGMEAARPEESTAVGWTGLDWTGLEWVVY